MQLPSEREQLGLDSLERSIIWAALSLRDSVLGTNQESNVQITLQKGQSPRVKVLAKLFYSATECLQNSLDFITSCQQFNPDYSPVYTFPPSTNYPENIDLPTVPDEVDTVEKYLIWCAFCLAATNYDQDFVTIQTLEQYLQIDLLIPFNYQYYLLSNNLVESIPPQTLSYISDLSQIDLTPVQLPSPQYFLSPVANRAELDELSTSGLSIGALVAVTSEDATYLLRADRTWGKTSGNTNQGGHTIEFSGNTLEQKEILEFTGDGVTVENLEDKTVINIPGGGRNGVDGVDGNTWISGESIPNNTDGTDGDFYWQSSGDYYHKIAGQWQLLGTLRGEDGINGVNGLDGADGATWLSGETVPESEGNQGDFYLQTSTGNYYQKDINWQLIGNLKGERGDPGPKGEPGNLQGASAIYLAPSDSPEVQEEFFGVFLDRNGYLKKRDPNGNISPLISRSDLIHVDIVTPKEREYSLIIRNPKPFIITNILTQSNTGSCTLRLTTDHLEIPFSEDSDLAVLEEVARGEKLSIFVDSFDSCENLSIDINLEWLE